MDLDPYLVLGVPRNCTYQQARRTFRASVRRHHPDRGGDEQKFIRICAAYKQIVADLERPVDTATTVRVAHEDFRDLLLRVSARSDPSKIKSRSVKSVSYARATDRDSGAVMGGVVALSIFGAMILGGVVGIVEQFTGPAAPIRVDNVVQPPVTRVEQREASERTLPRTPFQADPGPPSRDTYSQPASLIPVPFGTGADGLSNDLFTRPDF